MIRSLTPFALLGLLAIGCSTTRGEEATNTDLGAASASSTPADTVEDLDALVTSINGYASADAWIVEHPRQFSDTLDDRFMDDARCTQFGVNEGKLRWVTRDRAGAQQIRKLGLTFASREGEVMVETHQTYHYDQAGKLRVVVIDREEDHLLDEPFIQKMNAHNEKVKAEHDAMPLGSEEEKVALANKMFEIQTTSVITQHRLYFRANGELFSETKTEGLDRALALEFDGIPQTPPSLYGSVHPANIAGAPYLTNLYPTPLYGFEPLVPKPATVSLQSSLIAANPFDAEASLAATPACR